MNYNSEWLWNHCSNDHQNTHLTKPPKYSSHINQFQWNIVTGIISKKIDFFKIIYLFVFVHCGNLVLWLLWYFVIIFISWLSVPILQRNWEKLGIFWIFFPRSAKNLFFSKPFISFVQWKKLEKKFLTQASTFYT
jgi:hypothetical protein